MSPRALHREDAGEMAVEVKEGPPVCWRRREEAEDQVGAGRAFGGALAQAGPPLVTRQPPFPSLHHSFLSNEVGLGAKCHLGDRPGLGA